MCFNYTENDTINVFVLISYIFSSGYSVIILAFNFDVHTCNFYESDNASKRKEKACSKSEFSWRWCFSSHQENINKRRRCTASDNSVNDHISGLSGLNQFQEVYDAPAVTNSRHQNQTWTHSTAHSQSTPNTSTCNALNIMCRFDSESTSINLETNI